MIEITYRKKMAAITQIWFCNTVTEPQNKADILFYHGMPEKSSLKGDYSTEFHTLISNLRQSEEELSARINKNVRYEIRRNKKEEGEYRIYSAAELEQKPKILKQFFDMYELMYREKGQHAVLNPVQIQAYLRADALLLTAVYQGEIPLVFHSYVVGEHEVRLLHSVSDFRSKEQDANLIARANKRLHWDDMLMFRGKGKEIYDWGGVSSLTEPNGIDTFKFKFGGDPTTYYNVYHGRTLLGKLIVFLMIMKRGI